MCYQLNYDYVHIWVSPHGEPVSGQLCACGKAAFYPAAQQPLAPDACPECGNEYSGACGSCAVGHERG